MDELVKLTTELLEVPAAPIRAAVEAELARADVVADTIEGRPCLFLRGLRAAERDIASRLLALARGDPPWPAVDAERALGWTEARTGKALSPSQRAAVALVLAAKVSVVTGGPGVGKTTLLDIVLRVLAVKGVKLLAAPTGRAAKRMAEQTGVEAKMVHRLLEVDRGAAASVRARRTRSTATSSWWMRVPYWTCR